MVGATLRRARTAGLENWASIEPLSETELEAQLYGPARKGSRPEPDPLWIHTERQRKGVTLELLHHEYLEQHPDGYRYTQFCENYRRWCKKRRLSMRQVHRAGEKLFVDYAGHKPKIVDRNTGEEREVELFVAAFGASSFTYAEATETQRVADFIGSHSRALASFGGVTELVIPDQLKSGVSRACRYEPGVRARQAEEARVGRDDAARIEGARLGARDSPPSDHLHRPRRIDSSAWARVGCARLRSLRRGRAQ